MKTPLLVSILLSSICLSGCSDSKYVDPSKACSFYDQINYGNVKSFSFEGGTYHLPNQTTSFYETTDTVALRKLVDCFKKGMSTLTKIGKTVEVSYNDYSGPSFSFSTEEATNYVHLDMFGYYFSSDPDLLLYSTDFDFSSVFEGKDLLVRFSYLLAPPKETITSYGEEIEWGDAVLDKISFTKDAACLDNRYVDMSSRMVIEDDSEHMVYLINANSFSYKQMMYKLSDGYSFESLLAKTSQKKEKRNVRIEFSSDFFLSIDLDESAPLTNDYLTKISISMLLNCGKDRTPLFSIYSDEERTKKVEDFSLTDNITLYGVF